MNSIKEFLADGGLKSRKLWFGVGCIIVLAAMVAVAAHCAAVAGLYADFVGGVVGIYGAYVGTNVANRWGMAKHLGSRLDDSDKPADSDQPDSK